MVQYEKQHTFVIPAYRESPFIEECIRSLFRQSIESDIIVSTSTPSEFLREITATYSIPLYIQTNSSGIASDWSFAYECAHTPFVTLAHQDDIYYSEYTKSCLNAANKTKSVIIFTNYCEKRQKYIQRKGLLLRVKRLILLPFFGFSSKLSSPALKKIMLTIGNPICCPTIMYNKEKIGRFVFDSSFRMNVDWDATIRLSLLHGDFIYLREILMIRRIHPFSETTNASKQQLRKIEDLRIIQRFFPRFLASFYYSLYSISHRLNK